MCDQPLRPKLQQKGLYGMYIEVEPCVVDELCKAVVQIMTDVVRHAIVTKAADAILITMTLAYHEVVDDNTGFHVVVAIQVPQLDNGESRRLLGFSRSV